jgi:predicted CoA-binding protein
MVTNKNEKVVVLGATPNPGRYAYLAANMLTDYGFDMIPIGLKTGVVAGKEILHGTPALENIHTVTLYLGPQNQLSMMQYILSLKPKRVIFNPGTENEDFEQVLERNGIEPVEACTLVMLRTGQF